MDTLRHIVTGGILLLGIVFITSVSAHYIGLIYYPPAVGNNGTLYVSGTDGILYGLNKDGSPRWIYNAGEELVTRAEYSDNKIFIATIEGTVIAVTETGSKAWSTRIPKQNRSIPIIAIVAGKQRIFVQTPTAVVALTTEEGSVAWRFKKGKRITGIGVGRNHIYIGVKTNSRGLLYSVTPTGDQLWRKTYTEPVDHLATNSKGSVYFETNGTVIAVSEDGSQKWRVHTGGLWREPSITNQLVVVGTFNGRILGIQEGKIRWEYSVGSAVAPTIGAHGRVYATTNEVVLAVDNGSLIWRTEIGPLVLQRPTVTSNHVYIGTQLNRTYALSTEGEIVWIDQYATPFGYGVSLPEDVSVPPILDDITREPTRIIPINMSMTDRTSMQTNPLTGITALTILGLVILAGILYWQRLR
ncbi:MAG: PQQ-binding-like beta-propeller repeat protein [Halobacteriaceae archaeon]